jgi:transcriptional regulator with XRE-family HTH domain
MTTLEDITIFSRAPSRPRRRLADDADTERVMRERLIVARSLNSLDQKEASAKLGYKNSSQLSKVESGDAPLPKSLLRKASLVYGVSTDWLLGLSNEPERDPRVAGQMAVMRAVNAAVLEHTQDVAAVMLRLAGDQLPLEDHLRRLLDAANRAAESFEKVCRNNASFQDDIRGGAALQRSIDDLAETTLGIKQFLSRRAGLVQARKPATSMPLFDDIVD